MAPRWQRATAKQVIQLGVGADAVVARSHDGAVAGWSFAGEPYGGFARVRAWRIVVAQRSRRVLVEHEDSNTPLTVIDAASGEVARLAPGKKPMRIAGRAIAPDGRTVHAVGSRDDKHWLLATWDADTGELADERPVPQCAGYLSTVAVTPDGKTLVAVGMHGVHSWLLGPRLGAAVLVAGSEDGQLYESYVQVLAVGGRTVVVACSIYGIVHAFDIAAATTVLRMKRTSYGKYVVLVPTRQLLVFPSQHGLRAVSALDPAASAIVDPGATGDQCAASVDGAVIAVSSAEDIRLHDAAALPAASTLPVTAADEGYRKLGSIKPAFHALIAGTPGAAAGTAAAPLATAAIASSSAASKAKTRVTKQPKKSKPRAPTRSSRTKLKTTGRSKGRTKVGR